MNIPDDPIRDALEKKQRHFAAMYRVERGSYNEGGSDAADAMLTAYDDAVSGRNDPLAAVPPMDKAEGVKLWRCPTCKESGRTCECRPEPLAPEAGEVVARERFLRAVRNYASEHCSERGPLLDEVMRLYDERPSPAALRVAQRLDEIADKLGKFANVDEFRALAMELRK